MRPFTHPKSGHTEELCAVCILEIYPQFQSENTILTTLGDVLTPFDDEDGTDYVELPTYDDMAENEPRGTVDGEEGLVATTLADDPEMPVLGAVAPPGTQSNG